MRSRAVATAALTLVASSIVSRAQAMPAFFAGAPGDTLRCDTAHVIVMTDRAHTVLTVAPEYRGPRKRFAWIIGVPAPVTKEDVETVPRELVDRIAEIDAPRLVELWEQDPCGKGGPSLNASGGGEGGGRWEGMGLGLTGPAALPTRARPWGGARAVLADATALRAWIASEKLELPAGADGVLAQNPSLSFVAVPIDPATLTFDGDRAVLPPLRVAYAAEPALPLRLGSLNGATQDVALHLLAREHRFEVGNMDGTLLPPDLDVDGKASAAPGTFYEALLGKARLGSAAVTEYAWEAPRCIDCPTRPLDGIELGTLGVDALPSAPNALSSFQTAISIWDEHANILEGLAADASDAIRKSDVHECVQWGAMTVKLVIAANGAVANVTVTRSNIADARQEACVVARLGKLAVRPTAAGEISLQLGFTRDWALDTPSWQLTRIRLRGAGDVTLREGGPTKPFRARYVVRHPWTGPMACGDPNRGMWGPREGNLENRHESAVHALFLGPRAATVPAFDTFLPSTAPTTSGGKTRGCGSCAVGAPADGPSWLMVLAVVGAWRRRLRAS